MAGSPRLFEQDLPPGFHYRHDFITEADERILLDAIVGVTFANFEMRGVVARRRVAFFGQSYDRGPSEPLPAFLLPLRATVAQWAGVDADAFAMALINEYRPGSPIGWHRDAPQFGTVIGMSLLGACRMRFQRGDGAARRTAAVVLEPRSAYVLTAAAYSYRSGSRRR